MGSILSALTFIDLLRRISSLFAVLRGLWKALKNNKLQTFLFVVGLIGTVILLNWAVRPLEAPTWTGFGSDPDATSNQGKTLWDWLELMLVPLVILLSVRLLKREKARSHTEGVERDKQSGAFDSMSQENQLRVVHQRLSQPDATRHALAVLAD